MFVTKLHLYVPTTAMIVRMVLGSSLLLLMAVEVVDATRVGYIHTKTTLLSGALGACDPDPNALACKGGITSASAYARETVTSGEVDFAVLVPQIDIVSAFTSMHPHSKGVNVDVYRRIHLQHATNNTQVLLKGYVPTSSVLASTNLQLQGLLDRVIQPLTTTIVPPSTSQWRSFIQPVMYVDISAGGGSASESAMDSAFRGTHITPIIALLHVDDTSRVWTSSTALSIASAGVGGQPSGYTSISATSSATVIASAIQTARRAAGVVILTSDDVAVTPEVLLTNMLQYEMMYVDQNREEGAEAVVPSLLPDVLLLQEAAGAFRPMTPTTINANFTAPNGTVITATRSVYIGAMSMTNCLLALDLDNTAVMTSANLPRSATFNPAITNISLRQFDPTTISNSTKDALYYDDQAYLLNLSRVAASNDPVVGRTLEVMPAAYLGPTVYTCYAGECGQSSMVTRALQWKFDADIAFIDSGGSQGTGWPAGNVHMSHLFDMFPFVNFPCYGTVLGYRILQIFTYSLSVSSFTPIFTPAGLHLLQAAGVRIEYAMQDTPDGIGAKIVSFQVYNKTTSQFQPLDRLRYYTFASNDYLCAIHGVYSVMLSASNAYRGESVNPKASSDTLVSISAEYLTANNPYTPILSNYYTAVPLTEVTDGSRSYLVFPPGAASCTSTQWYDAGIDSCWECPPNMQHSTDDVSSCIPIITTNAESLIVGLAVGGGLLIVAMVVIGTICECRRRSGSRSNGNAPTGDKDVVIVFTDIKSSTRLWGAVPASMGIALDAHHAIIRQAIASHKGYEVKTVGDSFMIAICDAQQAVDMSISIQHALYQHEWPSAINAAYLDPDTALDDPEDVHGPPSSSTLKRRNNGGALAPPSSLWNGLQVRIGIHYGPVEVIFDEVSKGYDYYGSTVNVAARVEGVTDGGQVCASEAVVAALRSTSSSSSSSQPTYTITELGLAELRGVKDTIKIYSLLPIGLEERVFQKRFLNSRLSGTGGGDGSGGTESIVTVDLSTAAPLDATSWPVRNIIYEAFRALSGDDRVAVLERFRKAWRVQLPSRGPFKGLDPTTSKSAVATRRHRQLSGVPQLTPNSTLTTNNNTTNNNDMHSSSNNEAKMVSLKADGGPIVVAKGSTPLRRGDSTLPIPSYHMEDENEEDIIFRVVAQRLAPRLTQGGMHSNFINCASLSFAQSEVSCGYRVGVPDDQGDGDKDGNQLSVTSFSHASSSSGSRLYQHLSTVDTATTAT